MKKHLLLLTTFAFLFYQGMSAQTCLPGGITLTTQAQIDAFPSNYPGCTEILGPVIIDETDSGNITNVNGLSAVTSIGGNLRIQTNIALASLTGLNALISVGGSLYISDNDALTSLTGLNALTSVGGELSIDYNNALIDLTGLNVLTSIGIGRNLYINENAALTSLTGLNSLTSVGVLYIRSNPVLTSLTGLNALTSVERNVNIEFNAMLPNLTGLNALTFVGSFFQIGYNDALTSLSGLNALTSVGQSFAQSLIITGNDALISLSGLDALTSIGGSLNISDNDVLPSLAPLSALTSIGGQAYIIIDNNDALTSLTGLDNIDPTTIEILYIVNSSLLSLCSVNSICSFLAVPSNPATISVNSAGCNTRAQVEAACLALPIELVSFTAKNIGNSIILAWQTTAEQKNGYFQIEHSTDGEIFKNIGTVNNNGNSDELQVYTFTITDPFAGVHYYRLKQMNVDGKYVYSNTITIIIKGNEISLFPNPTTGIIEIQGKNGMEGTVRWTDHVGRLIQAQQLSSDKGIDISDLPAGMYFVEILTDSQSIVKRIIKE